MSISTSKPEIVYPDSDGEPIAENTVQYRWIVTFHGGLDLLFRDRDDVFVAADLLWYPVEGDNKYRMAPDAMVAFGRPKGDRGSYMQWREGGISPQVVFEILSPGNRRGEMEIKFDFYERHGVEEYYVYDPDRVALKGWLREGGTLREIAAMDGWVSPLLGIRFDMGGEELRVFHPDGRAFETFMEVIERSERETARAERAEVRAERESARTKRAHDLAERERARAEQAQARADEEGGRAEQERVRAERAEDRARRMAAQLRAMGIEPES